MVNPICVLTDSHIRMIEKLYFIGNKTLEKHTIHRWLRLLKTKTFCVVLHYKIVHSK